MGFSIHDGGNEGISEGIMQLTNGNFRILVIFISLSYVNVFVDFIKSCLLSSCINFILLFLDFFVNFMFYY